MKTLYCPKDGKAVHLERNQVEAFKAKGYLTSRPKGTGLDNSEMAKTKPEDTPELKAARDKAPKNNLNK